MKFKIGDKIRIIKKELSVDEERFGFGMEGEIIDCYNNGYYQIKSKSFINKSDYCFSEDQIELLPV